jgi:uncharacterized protein with HEPN domain
MWAFRLRHILDAIARIEEYTAGLDEAALAADRKTLDAVIRNFQVVGEAARRVPAEVQAAHPEIPWSDVQKMRHVLVHDYDTIRVEILWRTIRVHLPPLVEPLKALLGDGADAPSAPAP